MLCTTELTYLSAPYQTENQQRFNQRIAKLVRDYNFPLLLPQEAREQLLLSSCLPDWQPSGALLNTVCSSENLPVFLTTCCMDSITRANLVLAVSYQGFFDPVTAFEVGYALGRRVNVVTIDNSLVEPEFSVERNELSLMASPKLCQATVSAPEADDRFPDRLIPILNRYFEPHKL